MTAQTALVLACVLLNLSMFALLAWMLLHLKWVLQDLEIIGEAAGEIDEHVAVLRRRSDVDRVRRADKRETNRIIRDAADRLAEENRAEQDRGEA